MSTPIIFYQAGFNSSSPFAKWDQDEDAYTTFSQFLKNLKSVGHFNGIKTTIDFMTKMGNDGLELTTNGTSLVKAILDNNMKWLLDLTADFADDKETYTVGGKMDTTIKGLTKIINKQKIVPWGILISTNVSGVYPGTDFVDTTKKVIDNVNKVENTIGNKLNKPSIHFLAGFYGSIFQNEIANSKNPSIIKEFARDIIGGFYLDSNSSWEGFNKADDSAISFTSQTRPFYMQLNGVDRFTINGMKATKNALDPFTMASKNHGFLKAVIWEVGFEEGSDYAFDNEVDPTMKNPYSQYGKDIGTANNKALTAS